MPLDADTIVVPVPDTAKAAADAMAFALKLPSVEGLIRNRYVGRTFIEGTADRAAKAQLKYTPLPEVLAGKRVLLVEDSIVRSTTMRALVHEIRDRGGAREIHLRVACPPIIAPCFYGIDMSRRDELFAPRFVDLPDGGVSEEAQQRMAQELGADSLRYLPVEAIARSVSLSSDRLCRACITGHYPTPTGQRLYQIDALESCHANGTARRARAPTRSPRRPPPRPVLESTSYHQESRPRGCTRRVEVEVEGTGPQPHEGLSPFPAHRRTGTSRGLSPFPARRGTATVFQVKCRGRFSRQTPVILGVQGFMSRIIALRIVRSFRDDRRQRHLGRLAGLRSRR